MKLRDPAVQKWMIIGGLAIGLAYGYWNYIYQPKKMRILQMEQKLKMDCERLERGKRVARNFDSFRDNYEQLLVNWDAALELLPTEKEMDDLLKQITLAGQSSQVTFLLFRPLEPVEHPYYWENPIRVKTLSTYHRLGEFMSKIAALPRIVNISNPTMTAWAPRKGRSHNTVETEFLATIYIFKELGVSATVSKSEEETPKSKPRRRS